MNAMMARTVAEDACLGAQLALREIDGIKAGCVREDGKIDKLHSRIDDVMRLLLTAAVSIIAVLIGATVTMVVQLNKVKEESQWQTQKSRQEMRTYTVSSPTSRFESNASLRGWNGEDSMP